MSSSSFDAALSRILNEPIVFREGCLQRKDDSAPSPKTCLSKLGEALLTPLGYCGRHWQVLNSQKNESVLEKITHVAKRILLVAAILFASVPAIIGSLLKCVSNPSLKETGNFQEWVLGTSPSQRAQCESLGLYDFDQRDYRIGNAFINLAKQHPEYPTLSYIHVRRLNNGDPSGIDNPSGIDYAATSEPYNIVSLGLSAFSEHTPRKPPVSLQRPNGNDFFRNMINSFLPKEPSPIQMQHVKVLEDLLLGIRSGTDEDYQILQDHLASGAKIVLRIHSVPDSAVDPRDPNNDHGKRIYLRIYYR